METAKSRIRWGIVSLLGSFAMLICSSIVWATDSAPARPNFVIMLADDLGYGDLSCYGHPQIHTPVLDRLAREGMRLTSCYASAPVCSPSRCGMLTGCTPQRLGIVDWIPLNSEMHLARGTPTLASLLHDAGYATCHIGKWHCNGKFNSKEQPQPSDLGFDYWMSTQNNANPSHLNPKNFVRNGTPLGVQQGYSSQLIVQEAIDWLGKRKSEQPFCLLLWFHTPHERVAAGPRFTGMYPNAKNPQQAEYFGDVTQMDHEIGRLLKAVDEMMLRESTFIMFTSDNGPERLKRYNDSSRSYGSPGPLRGMKLSLNEGGIREPGIMRFPGRTPQGVVSDEPICNTDLLPTLCELAGVKLPATLKLDGESFAPLVRGEKFARAKPLYWQYDRATGPNKVALRKGNWKLLADGKLENFELYDLAKDIGETQNLAKEQPERVGEMRAKLESLHRDIEEHRPHYAEK